MKHSEQLNSQELVQRTKEANLVALLLEHIFLTIETVGPRLPREVLGAAAEGFKSLADNEDFQPVWEDFFPTPELKEALLDLDAKVLQPVLQDHPERRAEL